MAATFEWKVYTGTNAATESPAGSATNLNLMNNDSYDSTGTTYQTYPITVPAASSAFSYERWIRGKFSGTFNQIDNMKFWKSAGTLSDAALIITAGISTTGVTPVVTDSTIATAAIPTAEGSALNPTNVLTGTGYSKYIVMQLEVPSTVTTPGDIGSQTVTFKYDEQ